MRARYALALLAISASALSASGASAVRNGARAPAAAHAAPRAEPFERDAPVLGSDDDREFYESLIHPSSPHACRDVSVGPSVAACFALSGLTPEIAGLNRVACLLDAVQRYKLAVADCAQQRADQWQETVMWPRSVLDRLTTATLARVQTLREQAEDLVEEWPQPESTRALAAVYTTPERVTRADHERAWGASRGPDRDRHEFLSWLSVHNRNTIQARTSAAFGLAGELPENTWERIGREGSRLLAESYRDPLAAMRHTPQLLADRARVDTNTARLDAQTLVTEQVLRDYRRAKRKRERALGWALLKPLLDAAEPTSGARSPRTQVRS